MFLPFALPLPLRAAGLHTRSTTRCLAPLPTPKCGRWCLHLLHSFRGLAHSVFWWLSPWTSPINPRLVCLVAYLTSPFARLMSISDITGPNWTPELPIEAPLSSCLRRKPWHCPDPISHLRAPGRARSTRSLKPGFKQHSPESIQMFLMLFGSVFDNIYKVTTLGS